MCQELDGGDEDTHILKFMNELTSVGWKRVIIVAQEVNTEEEVLDGYSIFNLHGELYVMTGKHLNGRYGEDETFYSILIGYELIEVANYLVRGPGVHLPLIYDDDPEALQTVMIIGFINKNWRKIEERFIGFIDGLNLPDSPGVDEDSKLTLKRTCGVSLDGILGMESLA